MNEPISPTRNTLSATFWDAAGDGRLMLPWCVQTAQYFWPPSPISPFKTSGAVEWRDADASGILVGMVVYRRAFQKALAGRMPYGVGLVELNVGPRLQVHIPDPESARAPRPGDHVTITFAPIMDDGPPVLTVTSTGA